MSALRALATGVAALAVPVLAPRAARAADWPGGVDCASTSGLGRTFVAGLNCRTFIDGGEQRRYVAWVSDGAAARMRLGPGPRVARRLT